MSSGMSGAIRGGKSFVEAWLDDNPLMKGLARLQIKLRSWQASLSTMGASAYGGNLPEPFASIARFAMSPAGAFTGLLAAAHHTASVHEEMRKMSEATGVGVEKLSALAYAARRAGVSNDALASALGNLRQKSFELQKMGAEGAGSVGSGPMGMGGGAGGGTGMANMFRRLGIDAKADPTEQLRQFQQATKDMSDTSRIGLAGDMGLSGILPLLNQGIEFTDKYTQRAKELGVTLNETDIRASQKFTLVLGDLHEVIMSSVRQIGGALIPVISGLTSMIVKVSVVVRDWIRDHKTLTMGIFMATGAIVAGGIALKGLAVVTGLASAVLSVFRGVLLLASGAMAVFNAVAALNPFVLIGVAIAGVIGYLAYLTGAFDGLSASWSTFAGETTSSIKAIFNAIAKGNLTEAWDVVTSYLQVEWTRVINWLQSLWEGFRGFFTDAGYGIALAWVNVTSKFKTVWADVVGWLRKKWLDFANGSVIEWIADKITWISAKIRGADAGAERKALREDFDRARRAAEGDKEKIDAETLARKKQIEDERAGRVRAIGDAANESAQARAARIAEGEANLQKKRDALRAAQDAANVPGPEDELRKKGEGIYRAAQSENRGTFSGVVASMIGGGGGNPVVKAIQEYSERQIANQTLEIERMDEIKAQLAELNAVQ